jgi:hypothetical protein
MAKATSWALVLLCMALIAWIRTLPLALSVVNDLANASVPPRLSAHTASEVPQDLAAPQRRAQIASRMTQWMTRQAAPFEAERRAAAERLQAQWRYAGADGREYVYLGDYDSYRMAVAEMQQAGCIVCVPASGGPVEIVGHEPRVLYASVATWPPFKTSAMLPLSARKRLCHTCVRARQPT